MTRAAGRAYGHSRKLTEEVRMAIGCSLDEATRTQFEVGMLVSGDLAGIAQ
jgi:hypothetical protein